MITDKMVMTARESVHWKKNTPRTWKEQVGVKKAKDGSEVPILEERSSTFQQDQIDTAQEYADRTGHQVALHATEADGTETLIATLEPRAT